MEKRITWKSPDGAGEENLTFRLSEDTIQITSRVRGGDSDLQTNWDASYSLVCDTHWHTRRFIVDEHLTNRHLELFSDGNGHWKDEKQQELSHLAGCIDIDFRATPFSNTLPIRRTNLNIGESLAITVAYINAPDLAVSAIEQIYTRIAKNTWKFQQPEANFEAIITVDDEGLVVDYPGLFYRV